MQDEPAEQKSNPDANIPLGLTEIINLEEIQILQDSFSDATGAGSIMTLPDGKPLLKPGNPDKLEDLGPGAEDYIQEAQSFPPILTRGFWIARVNIMAGDMVLARWMITDKEDDNFPDKFTRTYNLLQYYSRNLSEKASYRLQLLNLQAELDKTRQDLNKATRELTQSENFLREIQNVASLGIYTFNIESGIWTSSETLDYIFGIGPDYHRSIKGWIDIIHPEWQQTMSDYFAREVLGKICRFDKEYKIVRIDSSETRWVHGVGDLTVDDKGKPVKMIGTIRDITESKLIHEALRESEEKYRLIFDYSPLGILSFDENGVISACNESFAKIIGSSVKRLFGLNMLNLPDKKLVSAIQESLNGHTGIYEDLYHSVTADKETFVRALFAPMHTGSGPPYPGVGIIEDVTARKRSEEEIKERKERYRGLSEAAFEAIFISEKGICIEQNPAAKKMFGYSSEEALGRYGTEWIAPEYRETVMENMLRGYEDPYEAVALRKDGTTFPCMLRGKMMHYKGRSVLVTSLSDISERKQAELRILELNAELDKRVRQRTEELEAAIKELETFSYSVSHDLKVPLRHISGFISLFLETKSTGLTGEELGHLNKISNAASEMGLLIDAILSFSRLSMTELRKSNIRTSSMVQEVIRFFEPETRDRNIAFRVGPIPDIKGDQELIRQVWTNLISNAIKYTGKKDEAVIEIGSFQEPAGTTFFVKDNGAGFNMKYAEKLYNVFQRLHKSRDFDGIGIGLANVNRIISRHGGMCRAEGMTDNGATFYFTLPA
ncbi:MAG: PAS domain S-box protein [Bacteroidales bacterium]